MNIFIKYHFNEKSWMQIREIIVEIFPEANIDEIIEDGKVINIDVSKSLERFGVPMEVLLPVVQMIPEIFKNNRNDSEDYVVKNSSTGEFLCKSRVDSMDNPHEPELYYFQLPD